MILGEYPCCDGPLSLGVPERTPCFLPQTCPHCGTKVWHLLSRTDPESWIESEFLRLYEVNEETRHITKRANPLPA